MTSVDRIQGLSGSLAVKVPCRVATTANTTLSGEQTIDGVAVVEDDRVLVKDQTDTTENGIYNASTGTWVRALDFDGNNDVVTGTIVGVTAGTVSAGFFFEVTTANPVVPGTSSMTFTSSAPAAASAAAAAASAAAAQTAETNAETAETNAEAAQTAAEAAQTAAEAAQTAAEAAQTAAEAAAATVPTYPSLVGAATKYIRVAASETAVEYRTAADVLADIGAEPANANLLETGDVGVILQGYDANTAKLNVDQTWPNAQRGTITTDNDLSFDLNATNNFLCTPTAGGTLTFTNHTAGQSGFILFINGSNYAITAAATTKCDSSFLSTISTTGTYLISYLDDGTNAYCVASKALA